MLPIQVNTIAMARLENVSGYFHLAHIGFRVRVNRILRPKQEEKPFIKESLIEINTCKNLYRFYIALRKKMKQEPLLLLLEQDLDDKAFLETILNDFPYNNNIRFFEKSADLLQFLKGYKEKALILLDFNTYPESAIELLPKLKNDSHLSAFPVIVFGESEQAGDIQKCYQLGASSYIVKSNEVQDIKAKMNVFFQYWLDVVKV